MAIVRIAAPATLPVNVTDYQAQNSLLAALILGSGEPIRIIGTNVVKGAVFNVGGVTYVADSDTAISGTASAYVKLTPSGDGSSCAASFVANLTGVTWSSTYGGYYDASWNLYIFDEALAYVNGQIVTFNTTKNSVFQFQLTGKQVFTSSGTFVVPLYVNKVWVSGSGGGGGGGGGKNSNNGNDGGNGNSTVFGALLSIPGGTGGKGGPDGRPGTPGNSMGTTGQPGIGGATAYIHGGSGGGNPFGTGGGGGGVPSVYGPIGWYGVLGGGGGGGGSTAASGGGGGAGGAVLHQQIIVSPGSSIGVTIGAAGTGGTADVNYQGGDGGSGILIVEW